MRNIVHELAAKTGSDTGAITFALVAVATSVGGVVLLEMLL
jgi:hypothetical protein